MPLPVSSEFRAALTAPLKDVTMRVRAVKETTDPSTSQLLLPGVKFAYLGAATDATGNSSAAFSGNAASGVTTRFCPASPTGYEFDGGNDYITVTGSDVEIDDEFTIAFWAERDLEVSEDVICWGSGSVEVRFNADSQLAVIKNGVANAWVSDNGYDDRLPHWYCITKRAGGGVEVFVDGLRVNGVASIQTFVAASSGVRIGCEIGSTTYDFDGKLDEVVVTDKYTEDDFIETWWNSFWYIGNLKVVQEVEEALEGVVYVDTDRKSRRTSQVRIDNQNGMWTPAKKEDAFWWDGMFTVEYGVKVGDQWDYIKEGTFLVERWEVLAENMASVLNIDGVDMWNKFKDSTFALPKAYFKDTNYNDIIRDMANAAGIYRMNLDPLANRASTEKQVQIPLYFEIDDNRGDKLWELCEDWGLDIWFDVDGALRTQDKQYRIDTIDNTAPVWTLAAGEDAVFVNITKSQTPDEVYNHIVASGEADDGGILIIAEAIDGIGTDSSSAGASVHYTNDYSSPLRVERVGDKVKRIDSTTWRTAAAAQLAANAELEKGSAVKEEIRIPTTVLPHIEGFDVIEIVEPTHTKTNDKYFLQRFDIPMRSGAQQEITVTKTRGI